MLSKIEYDIKELKDYIITSIDFENNLNQLEQIAINLKSRYLDINLINYWCGVAFLWEKLNSNLIYKSAKDTIFLEELYKIANISNDENEIENFSEDLVNWLKQKVPINDNLEKSLNNLSKEKAINIQEKLPSLLAADIVSYMKNKENKFVLIIDNYKESWSKNIDFFSKNTPIFWLFKFLEDFNRAYTIILSGIEPIKLTDNKFNLTTLELNNFTKHTSKKYLEKLGVKDSDIIEQMIKNSNGLPLYLYLESLTYLELKNPTKEVFNTQESVFNRFFNNLNNNKKEVLASIAGLEQIDIYFTKQLLQKINEELDEYYINIFNEVLDYNFIKVDTNGNYRVHELIKKDILNYLTKNDIVELKQLVFKYYESIYSLNDNEYKNANLKDIELALTKASKLKKELSKDIIDYAKWLLEVSYNLIENVVLVDSTLIALFNNLIPKLETLYPNSKILAQTYNHVAYFYKSEDDLKALNYYKKALKIDEKLANNSLNLAKTYNNIAQHYYDIKKYKKSKKYYKKALDIKKVILEESNLSLSITYNNLGFLYINLKKYKKALKYFKKALIIRKQKLKKNHYDLATTYFGIANTYNSLQKYKKAIKLYKKAYKIRKKVYGMEHSHTIMVYNELEKICKEKEYYIELLKLYKNELNSKIKELDKKDYNIALLYNKIGLVYHDMKEYDKALEYYFKDLAISKETLGVDNLDIAIIYINIATVYEDKRDYKKALDYYFKALDIREQQLTQEHLDTAQVYYYIATLFKKAKDYKSAIVFYFKSLNIEEKLLGREHLDVAITHNALGIVFHKLKDYKYAISAYKMALMIREKKLGEHIDTAITYSNLAKVLYDIKDIKEAIYYMQKALNIFKKNLPNEHFFIKSANEALIIYKKSLEEPNK